MKTLGTLGNNGHWHKFDEGTSGALRTLKLWSETTNNANW
jgi:hypothetical protein